MMRSWLQLFKRSSHSPHLPSQSGKVDFLICGTQKGGTTALHHYLSMHPEIRLPFQKELHFFDEDRLFHGSVDYQSYHRYFPIDAAAGCFGEATPIYMYWKEAAHRIRQYHPGIKLIVSLRNPAERSFSHWHMEFQRGREPLDFPAAIRAEPDRMKTAPRQQHRIFSYLDRGRYAEQLTRLLDLFPSKQLHVLHQEDILENPVAELNRICVFLGVSPMPAFTPDQVFAQTYSHALHWDDRCHIWDQLYPQIQLLEKILGQSLSAWQPIHPSEAPRCSHPVSP